MNVALAVIGLGGGELMIIMMILMACVFVPLWVVPPILCYLLLDRIPSQDRRQEPGMALLLLIPIFNLFWAFWVYPAIADSLAAHFRRRGDLSVGDGGRTLALIVCIFQIIPGLNLAAFICEIVFFVKSFGLTNRISRPMLERGSGVPAA